MPFALLSSIYFFFFNDTSTTEIYTLSLHDALPICRFWSGPGGLHKRSTRSSCHSLFPVSASSDRKSTRLNSSHQIISYAVFCLKKKKMKLLIPNTITPTTLFSSAFFFFTSILSSLH